MVLEVFTLQFPAWVACASDSGELWPWTEICQFKRRSAGTAPNKRYMSGA